MVHDEMKKISRTQRLSNIELLRIVSMMMVVMVHIDGASLGLPELGGDLSRLDARSAWQLGVESLTIIGVNCFTLISGYFSIRLRVRGICSFLLQCAFYAVGIYLLMSAVRPQNFSWGGLAESAMVLTHTDLWYVPAYFLLMLLAPLINAGFEALSPRRALWLTAGIVIYNVWAGWFWGGKFNPTGYTVVQLVMVYCIGRCLALYRGRLIDALRRPGIVCGAVYAVATLATAAMAVYLPPVKAFAYNQPFVIVASVAFFLAFASVDFRSRAVNVAARSAFAVYLIHKAPAVWGGVMRPRVVELWNSLNLWEFTLAAIALTVGIYLVAMPVDYIRRRLLGGRG